MVTIGMTKVLAVKSGLLALSLLVLSACGGDSDEPAGGGSPGGAPSNSAPTANAGPDQNVGENSTVDLDGTGSSDPDGDALTYAWVQTEGPSVSLSDANSAQSSFTAPGVTAGSTLILGFQLTVDDGITSATDSVEVTVSEAPRYSFSIAIMKPTSLIRRELTRTVIMRSAMSRLIPMSAFACAPNSRRPDRQAGMSRFATMF
jgi:hypothetical protein